MQTLEAASSAATFEKDGFLLCPQLVPDDLVARASTHMDEVIAGRYETGIAPLDFRGEDKDPKKIIKIDDSQLSDRTILECISYPEIGRWAAKITGAKMIQAWVLQLLYKPSVAEQVANVGWHQDQQYWSTWWEPGSELFTAWLAISDVTLDAGPMSFVPGSQNWGSVTGNFWEQDNDSLKAQIRESGLGEWNEVPAVLPPGACSFHHRMTLHGSGPNTSGHPRRSFAIHLRTENSVPRPESEGGFPKAWLEDPSRCPIIYQE